MDTTITIKLQFDTGLIRDLIERLDEWDCSPESIDKIVSSFKPLVLTDKIMPLFIYKSLIREIVSSRIKSLQIERLISEKEAQMKLTEELIEVFKKLKSKR